MVCPSSKIGRCSVRSVPWGLCLGKLGKSGKAGKEGRRENASVGDPLKAASVQLVFMSIETLKTTDYNNNESQPCINVSYLLIIKLFALGIEARPCAYWMGALALSPAEPWRDTFLLFKINGSDGTACVF